MHRTLFLGLLVLATPLALAACGDDDDGGGGGPFELTLAPEFVQGALPGVPTTMLVSVSDEGGGGPVELDASVDAGATVSVEPAEISPGEIAEVTFTGDQVPAAEEKELTVTVTARRGSEEREATKPVIVMPGVDDRQPQAREILAVFLPWLAEQHPEMGIGPDSELDGMLVAPRLLVVSHYAFFNQEYEIGLAWHVMVAPDDWSDIYIRPRDELQPTAAYRLSSWTTALSGGDYEITPAEVPVEVMR